LKTPKLIADSGGTKTDWCFVNSNGEKYFFTTESYHPRNLAEYDLIEQKMKWTEYSIHFNLEVHFYGAGCLSSENQQKMVSFFTELGFRNVFVLSDVFAAGLAMNGGEGWGAICGTGSVAFKMEKGKLTKIHGGLGRELSDEGSGYYFGKLVVSRIAAGQIRINDFLELRNIELIPENYAQIPKLLTIYMEHEQIKEIHESNILEFAKAYLDGCKEISFCGSYAFYHQAIFSEVLQKMEIQVHSFLERPIEKLVEYKIMQS